MMKSIKKIIFFLFFVYIGYSSSAKDLYENFEQKFKVLELPILIDGFVLKYCQQNSSNLTVLDYSEICKFIKTDDGTQFFKVDTLSVNFHPYGKILISNNYTLLIYFLEVKSENELSFYISLFKNNECASTRLLARHAGLSFYDEEIVSIINYQMDIFYFHYKKQLINENFSKINPDKYSWIDTSGKTIYFPQICSKVSDCFNFIKNKNFLNVFLTRNDSDYIFNLSFFDSLNFLLPLNFCLDTTGYPVLSQFNGTKIKEWYSYYIDMFKLSDGNYIVLYFNNIILSEISYCCEIDYLIINQNKNIIEYKDIAYVIRSNKEVLDYSNGAISFNKDKIIIKRKINTISSQVKEFNLTK